MEMQIKPKLVRFAGTCMCDGARAENAPRGCSSEKGDKFIYTLFLILPVLSSSANSTTSCISNK